MAPKRVLELHKELKKEWTAKPQKLEKIGDLLEKLKLCMIEDITFLPTMYSGTPKDELLIARDVLEIGAQYSVAVKDTPSFQRYMAQLRSYYMDYKELPESAYMYQLLGLNLLCLLCQNRVAEFHTEIELLPTEVIQGSVYIKHPLLMEQYLMEGSYNKVFLGKGIVPDGTYNYFLDILLDTIRDEIAGCMEKAYDKITPEESAKLLYFTSQSQLVEFAKKRGWEAQKGYYYFECIKPMYKEDSVPSADLAKVAIEYASQLEMIV